MYFACTGIIIESNSTITSFLTSLSLLRSIDDDSKIFQDMMVGTANFLCFVCFLLICDDGNHSAN